MTFIPYIPYYRLEGMSGHTSTGASPSATQSARTISRINFIFIAYIAVTKRVLLTTG